MTPASILVIDDEKQIRRVVRNALESDGARVLEASTGREGMDMAAADPPDLIVLDLGLPDVGGEEICRDLRGWFAGPIVVLSARHSDREKAALLDLGADDYVTKPFSTIELQARIRAQLRRARAGELQEGESLLEKEGVVIDLSRRSVFKEGQSVHLTPIEWDLLRALIRHAGRTMTHRQLFAEVWSRSHGDPQQYLRVHIANLRRKLERDPLRPRLIMTESGVGYRFETTESTSHDEGETRC